MDTKSAISAHKAVEGAKTRPLPEIPTAEQPASNSGATALLDLLKLYIAKNLAYHKK